MVSTYHDGESGSPKAELVHRILDMVTLAMSPNVANSMTFYSRGRGKQNNKESVVLRNYGNLSHILREWSCCWISQPELVIHPEVT